MWAHGFRRCFTPLSGCFSPFPRGTGSLSVIGECSALEGGPPCFSPGFTCPDLLGKAVLQALPFRVRGSHPVPPAFPGRSATTKLSDCSPGIGPWDVAPRDPRAATPSGLARARVWAGPVSLAATPGISVDFSSSGYLDVSVPPVASARPMCSAGRDGK